MIAGKSPFISQNKEEILKNIEKGQIYFPFGISEQAKDLIKNVIFLKFN